jgi:hypothetical protein
MCKFLLHKLLSLLRMRMKNQRKLYTCTYIYLLFVVSFIHSFKRIMAWCVGGYGGSSVTTAQTQVWNVDDVDPPTPAHQFPLYVELRPTVPRFRAHCKTVGRNKCREPIGCFASCPWEDWHIRLLPAFRRNQFSPSSFCKMEANRFLRNCDSVPYYSSWHPRKQ